ncbi:YaiO family outer membrane beta-barrel protein [Gaoshiqia sp. Z1-71]|uniref:YaiO family outer membrane beta-barrel protein n=1 Tax=Gaoshiqia hydrogeniformans TaxID=3290090 RepID=UPI003BF8EA71
MKLLFLFSFGVLLLTNTAYPQLEKPFNADSVFMVARQLSIDGKYSEAINLAEQLLAAHPEYTDARILVARTYAWQKKYEPAGENISKVLNESPAYYDAHDARIDILYWSGRYEAGLDAIDEALKIYPDDVNFLIKKAKIQIAGEDYTEARTTIQTIKKLAPEEEALGALTKAVRFNYSNIIRLEHYFDMFDSPYRRRWHMSSLGYGGRTAYGDFYLKVYTADMVMPGEKLFSNAVAYQYALEAYPKFDENNYMFVNYAYSENAFFPRRRLGVEYFYTFGSRFEISAGYRFMDFTIPEPDDLHVNIFTGSIAKYLGSYYASFRPYISYDGENTTYNYLLSGRRYLNKEESYLELVLGTGVSPDNPYFYTSGEEIPQLDSWRVELEWKQKISHFLLFEIEGGYENAEYRKGSRRDQFIFRTALSFLF